MTTFTTKTPAVLAREDARLEHIGFVVPSLEAAGEFYSAVLGCDVTVRQERPGEGIAKAYVRLANLTVELIEPITPESPIKDLIGDHSANEYLRQHPGGGIHHVCYSVADLPAACNRLKEQGHRILGSGAARVSSPGAIVFVDPLTTHGALIELKGRI